MARSHLLESIAVVGNGELPNLATRLEAALPAAQVGLLTLVAQQAAVLSFPLYVVGGVVRDLLLERPIKDVDLVVEGDAIRLGRELVKEYGGDLVAHRRFGTAKWELVAIQERLAERLGHPPGDLPAHLDLISARKEIYKHSGALPTVKLARLEDDLARRDFGINTLALRLDGEHYGQLLDPLGGLQDLKQGRLRVLHAGSFEDDPTRILRILRFAGRLNFEIEPGTLGWLKAALPQLGNISVDRIRHELDAILVEPQRIAIVHKAQELGLLAAIHPSLAFPEAAATSLERLPGAAPEDYWDLAQPLLPDLAFLLWLQHLPDKQGQAVASHLLLAQSTQAALAGLQRLAEPLRGLVDATPSQAVAVLDQVPPLALYVAHLDAGTEAISKLILRYVKQWRHVQPGVDGHELQRRGLQAGPAYSRILTALRAAWLDGEIQSPEQESALLDRLIAEHD